MNYEQAKEYFYSHYEELEKEFNINVDYFFSKMETIIKDLEDIKNERGE